MNVLIGVRVYVGDVYVRSVYELKKGSNMQRACV